METKISPTHINSPPVPNTGNCSGGNFCNITKDLTGQVIIITGANTGIGKETARRLAYTGATIIFACRDQAKTLPVIQEIQQETKNSHLEFIRLDIGDLASIKEFVKEFQQRHQKLNILINNAGINIPERKLTKDGFECQFGINHLGPFYLTTLCLDTLKNSSPSRIINVASNAHEDAKINWEDLMSEKEYSMLPAYGQSKLATVLFTKELSRRLESSNVKVVCLHPGAVRTELTRDIAKKWIFKVILAIARPFQKSPEEGAQTTIYCALEDEEKLVGGAYYVDLKVKKENSLARNEENGRRMWEVSEKLISEKVGRL